MSLVEVNKALEAAASKTSPDKTMRFFKTGPGTYSAHDRFLGVPIPELRKIAKQNPAVVWQDLEELLYRAHNEERALALIYLVNRFKAGDEKQQREIYEFYLKHKSQVNNWNLVDISAHYIVGAYLLKRPRHILDDLSRSPHMWDRRIAIVSTWTFIKAGDFTTALTLAERYVQDPEDLMHKATGWMLREVGKQDEAVLRGFLDQYAPTMPRTMLRYAIEKLSPQQRRHYMTRP